MDGILYQYRLRDHSFLCELNPIKRVSKALERQGVYESRKGIDLNCNFIDSHYLKTSVDVENLVYRELVNCKDEALRMYKDFLCLSFGVNVESIGFEVRFETLELSLDIHADSPSSFIEKLEVPIKANYGHFAKIGSEKDHSIVVYKKARNSDTTETGKKSRILYQKSPGIVRFERFFTMKEIGEENIADYEVESLQALLSPLQQAVQSEVFELEKQAPKEQSDNEGSKLALTLWIWQHLAQVKIPSDKFYLIEKLIETEQLDFALLAGEDHFKKQLKNSGLFVCSMESEGKKNIRYWRLDKEKFLQSLSRS